MVKRRRLSNKEREEIWAKTKGHCAYCGREIALRDMKIDHVIPMRLYDIYKSRGKDTDTLENMLPACQLCNQYKKDMSLEEFRKAIFQDTHGLYSKSVTCQMATRYKLITFTPRRIVFYFEKMEKAFGSIILKEEK